jgi:cytochrome c
MEFRHVLLLSTVLLGAAVLFAQSAAKNSAGQAPPSPAQISQGKKIYEAHCAICHFAASTKKKIGPGLKGLSQRGVFGNGKKVNDESLRAWIETGGKDMPGFRDSLKNGDVRDLIAYLKSL